MKYIKLYEGYIGYTEISDIEWSKYTGYYHGIDKDDKEESDFTLTEISYLRDNIKDKYSGVIDYEFTSPKVFKYSSIHIKSFFADLDILLDKYNDEWYLVRFIRRVGDRFTYYKCDQWDGMLNLLKDKDII